MKNFLIIMALIMSFTTPSFALTKEQCEKSRNIAATNYTNIVRRSGIRDPHVIYLFLITGLPTHGDQERLDRLVKEKATILAKSNSEREASDAVFKWCLNLKE